MIVNVGKRIIVNVDHRHVFTRDCSTPGLVELTHEGNTVRLPGNLEDARRIIAAYERILAEPVEYVSGECE